MTERTPEEHPARDVEDDDTQETPAVEETGEDAEADRPPFYRDPEADDAPESNEPPEHLAPEE